MAKKICHAILFYAILQAAKGYQPLSSRGSAQFEDYTFKTHQRLRVDFFDKIIAKREVEL
jgi:hypothetical protein